jgi:glycosyltransferase involved in cell wall biosynthesis
MVPDVVFCCHWAMLPIAVLLQFLFRCKLIYDEYDYQEILLEDFSSVSYHVVAIPALRAIKRMFLKHCDLITCRHLKDGVHSENLLKYNKNVLELNNYPHQRWRMAARSQPAPAREMAFLYIGKVCKAKQCELLVDAFKAAMQANPRLRAELHFFGPLVGENGRLGNFPDDGIFVHGPTAPGRIREFCTDRRCVGILLYDDRHYYHYIGTNSRKMYEYLALGIPILASRLGEIEPFLTNNNIGYLVEPRITVTGLTDMFLYIAENPHEIDEKAINAKRLMADKRMWWEAEWRKVLDADLFDDKA